MHTPVDWTYQLVQSYLWPNFLLILEISEEYVARKTSLLSNLRWAGNQTREAISSMLMGLNKKKLNMQKHHTKLCESTSYKLLSDRDIIEEKGLDV